MIQCDFKVVADVYRDMSETLFVHRQLINQWRQTRFCLSVPQVDIDDEDNPPPDYVRGLFVRIQNYIDYMEEKSWMVANEDVAQQEPHEAMKELLAKLKVLEVELRHGLD